MKDIIIESNIIKPKKRPPINKRKPFIGMSNKEKLINAFIKMKEGDSFELDCSGTCAFRVAREYRDKANKNFCFSIVLMIETDIYRFFKNKDKK